MEQELLELALLIAHPPADGWRQLGPYELDGLEVHSVFYRKGHPPVVVVCINGVTVKPEDIQMAEHLRTMYMEKMNGRKVRLLLAYEGLLVPPVATPTGIYVMSVSQCDVQYDNNPSLN